MKSQVPNAHHDELVDSNSLASEYLRWCDSGLLAPDKTLFHRSENYLIQNAIEESYPVSLVVQRPTELLCDVDNRS